ncbi:MAG: hypothetical protein EBY28_06975 [Betaproteobacteria bacterium]|nr:hypothetical protein [Betaproteobacteria bacterium]
MLGLAAIAGLLVGLFPDLCSAVVRSLRASPGSSLLLGLGWVVGVPVGVVLLFVTVIGLPLGMVTLALYVALLPIGYVVAALAFGQWGLQRWRPQRAEHRNLRPAWAAALLLALSLLALLPVLGPLIGLLLMSAGLGALLKQVGRPQAHCH